MQWISALGGAVQPTDEMSDAGIIYLSHSYRLRDGQDLPLLTKDGAGGDLGYVASPVSTATTGRSRSPSESPRATAR